MNKLLVLFAFLFALGTHSHSQSDIKINALGPFFGQYQIGFDQGLDPNTSVGLNLSYTKWEPITITSGSGQVDSLSAVWHVYSVMPNARLYTNPSTQCDGFFIEGYLRYRQRVNPDQEVTLDPDPISGGSVTYPTDIRRTSMFIGLSLGNKWVTESGFFVDLAVGYGRRFYHKMTYTNGTLDDLQDPENPWHTFQSRLLTSDFRFALSVGVRLSQLEGDRSYTKH